MIFLRHEGTPLKIIPLVLTAALICMPAAAKTKARHSSVSKTISGSGCVEHQAENSCRVIIDSQTGETYNLKFSDEGPRPGTAIRFQGTLHHSANSCSQGKPLSVSKWKKEKGIKCPPPLYLQAMK